MRRTPGAYAQLIAAESAPLPDGPRPELIELGYSVGAAPAAIGGAPRDTHELTPHALTALALTSGSASLERVAEQTAIDAGGLVPDLDAVNSWTRRVHEVDPVELLEVQLCNVDRTVRAGEPAARIDGGGDRAPQVRRERVGDGGSVRPHLQGRRTSAHEHGEGRREHADAHERARPVTPRAF